VCRGKQFQCANKKCIPDHWRCDFDQVAPHLLLRIRDVYSGSGIFYISDPGSEFFPSRIRIKEFKYFNPKKLFLRSRKYDPGCSFRIRIRNTATHPSPPFSTWAIHTYFSEMLCIC
jgi:hypothetical protein